MGTPSNFSRLPRLSALGLPEPQRRGHSTVPRTLASESYFSRLPRPTLPDGYIDAMTFGIELEFHIIYPLNSSHSTPPDDPLRVLYRMLRNAGIPASSFDSKNDGGFSDNFETWRIDMDGHEILPGEVDAAPEGYGSISAELSSPVFLLRDEASWRDQISKVISILEGMEKVGYRIICNEETGFHCHIGNAQHAIPLHVALSVLQTVTAFERCFDLLHSVSRIQHTARYCAPPSRFFKGLSKYPEAWLRIINDVTTHEELRNLFAVPYGGDVNDVMTNGNFSAYNFDNLQPATSTATKNTIEFRQHPGTLHRQEIFNWVKLCGYLVRSHCWVSKLTHIQFLRLHMHDTTFHTINLLTSLYIPSETVHFYLYKIGLYQAPNGWRYNNYMRDRCTRNASEALVSDQWREFRLLIEQRRLDDQDNIKLAQAVADKYLRGDYGDWGQQLTRAEAVYLPGPLMHSH